MSSSGNFESKITLKTQLDTAGVIQGLRQIQQQLQEQAKVNPANFTEINKKLEEAEKKAEELQKLSKAGLTSTKDVERMRALTESFNTLVKAASRLTSSEIRTGFENAIRQVEKEASAATEKLNEELNKIRLEFRKGVMDAGGNKALLSDLKDLRKKGVEYGEAVNAALKPLNNSLDEMSNKIQALNAQIVAETATLKRLQNEAAAARTNVTTVTDDVKAKLDIAASTRDSNIQSLKKEDVYNQIAYAQQLQKLDNSRVRLLKEQLELLSLIQKSQQFISQNSESNFTIAGQKVNPFNVTSKLAGFYNSQVLGNEVNNLIKELAGEITSIFKKVGGGPWSAKDRNTLANALISSVLSSSNTATAMTSFLGTKIGGKNSESFKHLTKQTTIGNALLTGSLETKTDVEEIIQKWFERMPLAQAQQEELARQQALKENQESLQKNKDALNANKEAVSNLTTQVKEVKETREKQKKALEEAISTEESTYKKTKEEQEKRIKEAEAEAKRAEVKPKAQQTKIDTLTGEQARVQTSYDAQKQKIEGLSTVLRSQQMTALYNEAIQKSKELSDQEKQTKEAIDALNRSRDEANKKIQNQNALLKASTNELYKELKATQSLTTVQAKVNKNFDQVINTILYRFSALSIIRTASRIIKQTFNDIQKLDKAFGSIAMVTSMSLNQLWGQYSQYATIANRLGQQTQSAIEASALYYQQGLQTVDVLKLTESTMKLATLAGQNFSEATKEMTAAIRAFHMEMSEGERITDVYSELAAHAAADVSGIATAMSKVASIAASSGAKFENISAFLTQIIETTQEAPSNAGTALKTVIARFSELKEEVDETDTETPYNKMDTALKSVGISLRDEIGQIRAFDEVILELGGIWDTLSRNQQRYIATTAAGSRQQSRFLALMENNKRLLELIDVAEESSGKSQLQFDKYADTIEYRINKLKNTWEKFRVSIFSSGTYKTALGYVNMLLERITKMTSSDLLTLGATFTLVGKTAAKGFLNGFKGTASAILQVFSMIGIQGEAMLNRTFGIGNNAKTGRIATSLMSKGKLYDDAGYLSNQVPISVKQGSKINLALNRQIFNGGVQTSALTQVEQDKLKAYWTQMDALAAQRGQAYGNTFATAALTAITSLSVRNQASNVFWDVVKVGAVTSATQAISGFSQALASSGNWLTALGSGGLTLGVTAGITALTAAFAMAIKAIKQYRESLAEANAMQYEFYRNSKAIEELQEKEKKLQEKLAETTTQYEQRKEEFEDALEKGSRLKELQDKILLTSEEKEEAVKLSGEIASFAPELIDTYDAEGNAIINLSSKYEELVKIKREAYALERVQVAQESAELASNRYKQAVLEQSKFTSLQDYVKNNQIFENIKNGIIPNNDLLTLEATLAILGSSTLVGSTFGPIGGAVGGLVGVGAALANAVSSTDIGVSEWLLQNNTKEMQYALQEIFKDSQTFNVADKTGSDIIDTIVDKLDESEQNVKLFNETIEKFSNSVKDYQKIILNASEELDEAGRELVTANLQLNPDFINAQKPTQQAMIRYGLYKSDAKELTKKIEDETAKFRAAGISQGYSGKELDDYVKLQQDAYWDSLTKQVQDIDYSPIIDANWENLTEEIANLPLNEATSILIEKLGESNEQVLAWIADNKQGIEAANKKAEELAEAFGLTLKRELNNQILTFDDNNELGQILERVGTVVWDRIINGLQSAEKSGKKNEFVETFKALAKDVSDKDLKEILNIQWENYTIFNADEMWKKVSTEGQKWRANLEGLMWNQDFSAEGIIKDIQAHVEALQKEGPYAAIEKALTTQFKEGFIDTASLKALNKASIPLDQLYNDDATINRELAEKYAKQITEEGINQALTLKQQYKQKTEILKTSLLELKAASQITSELYRQQLIQGGLSSKEVADEVERFEKSGKNLTKLEEQIEAREEAEPEFLRWIESYINDQKALYANMMNQIEEAWQKQVEEEEKATKALEDAAKKVKEAYEDIIKKQEALAEAQQKLNDTLYGSGTRKSSLDGLYNYQTALDALNTSIEEIKENLEDFQGSPKTLIDQLFSATRNKTVYLNAENDRYNAAINSTYNSLRGRVNDYMKTIGGGANYDTSNFFLYNPFLDRYEIDQAAINSAKINDDLKGFIENQIDLMNQYKKNIQNNNKEIKKTEKDLEDYKKKARDNYVSVEEEVVKKLEEFYKKEVDDKKKMYDALSDADNKYLDALQKAIDKQRRLRDQQNKWDDLTEKEKRLSLIQRDTSGSTRKEIQKLQKEIKKDRESMLDTAVDNVVNELKEFYEVQKETREDELKYQEAILENSNYVAEANAIMQSWKSLDDMRAWMYEHTKNIEDMSDASVEKLSDDWEKMFNNIQVYNELQQKKVEDNFKNTSDEIQKVILGTSESLTSEASRAFEEIKDNVNKAIKSAKESVENAMKALADAQEKYNELLKEENKLIEERKKQQDIKDYLASIIANGSNEKEKAKYQYSLSGIAREEAIKSITSEIYNHLLDGGSGYDLRDKYSDLEDSIFESAFTAASRRYENEKYLEGFVKASDNNNSYHLSGIAYDEALKGVTKGIYERLLDGEILRDIVVNYSTTDSRVLAAAMTDALEKYINDNIQEPQQQYNYSEQDLQQKFHEKDYSQSFKEKKFATGGLVDYTGLAWVDGTKNRPEAFLTSEDTMRIGQAANILRDLASYSRTTFSNATLSPNVRESNTEIHIHVDSIATESQVDYLIDRLKEEIVDAANPIGSSVILH